MTNIVRFADDYAQALIAAYGNPLAAIEGLKAERDANGRINGLPGTAGLADEVIELLEAQITDADINAALADHDIVRRKEDPEAQETLVTYPTPGGFKDAAALVRFLVAVDGENRTVSKVLGWLKAGDRVWATFGYWRLERKPKRFQDAPKANPETLSAYQIEKLKSEGRYYDAGFEAFRAGFDDSYGCHYGLRSERGDAIKAYRDGWAAAKAAAEAPKAPEDLTVDELAAELTQELPGDLIDAEGGVWHVKVTDVSHIRPERALWVERALGNHTGVEPAIYGFYAPSLRFAKAKLGVKPVDPQGHEVDLADLELRVLAGWADFAPKCPLDPARARFIADRYVSPVIFSAGRRLGDWLTEAERVALVAYIGSDDVDLVNAWIEAVAEALPTTRNDPEGTYARHIAALEARQDAQELRKLQQGHQAFERAARRGWDAQDVAWRTQALKGLQDSRNAAQVAA
jgi:hypothetical protein